MKSLYKNLEIEWNYADEPVNRTMSKPIHSLQELRQVIESLEHPLKQTALSTVFGSGSEKARLMLIGEAPGADEDKQGVPFVGRSGQLLTKMLESIGLSRDDVYITNIVPWRPPLNRAPTREEMEFFLPYVQKHIQVLHPECIVLLGSVATQTLLPNATRISQARGKWHTMPVGGKSYTTLPTFHPSYLLRSPMQKKLAWQDMLTLARRLEQHKG